MQLTRAERIEWKIDAAASEAKTTSNGIFKLLALYDARTTRRKRFCAEAFDAIKQVDDKLCEIRVGLARRGLYDEYRSQFNEISGLLRDVYAAQVSLKEF